MPFTCYLKEGLGFSLLAYILYGFIKTIARLMEILKKTYNMWGTFV
jgi:hypothetical protein